MIIMAQTLKSFETRIRPKPPEKETIHSGHFMVSKFEAEEPDDDDDVAVPVPDAMLNKANMNLQAVQSVTAVCSSTCKIPNIPGQSIAIETSLAKLFQCMSLAYRQKLTSPKWNRFKGIKLRWKDKIRLNNVIWRCWHMQFITKKNSLVCQFASPLDVDTHNKPEAVVLEGKYWKRKLNAVTAEYKKWRMFYRNQLLGWGPRDCQDMISEMDFLDWQPHSNDSNMMVDEDYMEFMSDTLFSSISAQPFAFPDPREIARGAGLWADLIQPSLVQLQPNLDDDVMDTLEPLHDLLCSKLPPVPEEISTGTASDSSIQDLYRALNGTYQDMTSEPPPPPPPLPSQKPLGGRNPPLYRSIKQEPQYTTYQYASQPSQSPRTSPGGSAYKPYTSIMPLAYNMNTQQPSHTATTHYQQLSPPPPPPLPPPPSQATCIQSAHSPPEFKLPSTPPPQTASSVYPMSSMQRTNMRSNSLPLCDKPMPQRRATEEVFAIPKLKHRNRSRSGSCLIQPGKSSTPTLISAGSDPAINTSQSPNALLHQLLTTNNNNCNAAPNYSYRGVTASNSMMDKSNICMTTDTMGSLPGSMEPRAAASYSFSQNQNATAVHNINTDSNDSVELIMPDNQPVMYSSHSPSDTFTFSANVTTAALSRRMAKNQPMTAILSQSPSTTLIVNAPSPLSISAQHSPQMVGSASNSPKHPDSPGNDSLSLSPLNVGSPNSPNQKTGRRTYKEHRRVCHINAEQKRRCTIKNGFDMLHALIPQLNQNPNAKLSKAAMLQKGGEYIRQLRNERNQLKEEMDSLRQQVECLNSAISNCQSMLPATGAPVSRHRTSRMKEMYNEYIRSRTQENWRFWLLSLICEPLLVSFNNTVSTASLDDLYRTTLIWVEQHCSLVDLRPVVLNALRHLCTSTEFLSDPTKLPSEAQAAAMKSHSSNS